MKKFKFIIIPFVFLLLLGVVSAASVTRVMTSRVDPGAEVQVTLTLNGAKSGEAVAIEDTFADTISIKSWEISGSKESKADVSYITKPSQKAGLSRNSWSFTASSGAPSITYKFDAPSVNGNLDFDVKWVTSEGFSHQASTLTVRTIKCGDGICEGSENTDNCLQDCPKAAPAPAPSTSSAAPEKTMENKPLSTTTIAWIVVAIIVVVAAIGYFMMKKKS